MSDDTDPAMPPPPPDGPAPSEESDGGFSAAEKTTGAAHKAPFTSSAAATFMLRYETTPGRREQPQRNRHGALMWVGVGIAVVIIGLIVIFSIAARR